MMNEKQHVDQWRRWVTLELSKSEAAAVSVALVCLIHDDPGLFLEPAQTAAYRLMELRDAAEATEEQDI